MLVRIINLYYNLFNSQCIKNSHISGAAAYTGSVTHSLSIAVIVCETTGQLSPLLPVLVCYLFYIANLNFC